MFSSSSFWVAVSFVVFCAFTAKYIKSAFLSMLDKYSNNVASKLLEAEKIKEEAEILLADAKLKYQAAALESDAIIAKAAEEADSILKEAQIEINNFAKRQSKLCLQKISQAEQAIINEIKVEAVSLAINEVKNKVISKLEENAKSTLLDESIQSFKKTLH